MATRRATKIVATLGPASSDPQLLEAMIRAGVNVVRLNFSHGKAQDHIDRAATVRAAAQRAVRVVRQHAEEWGLDPNRIGFMGASAAGHMAASLGGKFAQKVYEPVDAADQLSARPDFQILLYPVVSMEDGVTHGDSRTNLIGKNPAAALIKAYSADEHVSKDTPRTFLVLADNDSAVPSENGLRYYAALRRAGVPAGNPDVYREGYVARVRDGETVIVAPVCKGDSGSGLLDDQGRVIGIVSAMTSANGCTFGLSL